MRSRIDLRTVWDWKFYEIREALDNKGFLAADDRRAYCLRGKMNFIDDASDAVYIVLYAS